jgi:site-specific recombinase XerD
LEAFHHLPTPINKTLKALFKSLPRHIKSDYVFCDKEGRPYKDVKRFFHTVLKKVCIEDFRFHDLRHSFASRLVMKGAGLKAVQELLGHKNIKMTMRYSHLSEDFKKDAVELLDRNFPDCQSSSNLRLPFSSYSFLLVLFPFL